MTLRITEGVSQLKHVSFPACMNIRARTRIYIGLVFKLTAAAGLSVCEIDHARKRV